VLVRARALMSDGLWDRLLGSRFPRPGVE
jgi:hypothetical protein